MLGERERSRHSRAWCWHLPRGLLQEITAPSSALMYFQQGLSLGGGTDCASILGDDCRAHRAFGSREGC